MHQLQSLNSDNKHSESSNPTPTTVVVQRSARMIDTCTKNTTNKRSQSIHITKVFNHKKNNNTSPPSSSWRIIIFLTTRPSSRRRRRNNMHRPRRSSLISPLSRSIRIPTRPTRRTRRSTRQRRRRHTISRILRTMKRWIRRWLEPRSWILRVCGLFMWWITMIWRS
jgi:hypothetical protein